MAALVELGMSRSRRHTLVPAATHHPLLPIIKVTLLVYTLSLILSATRSTGNDAIFPLALLRIAHWRTKIYADFSHSTRLVYSNIVAAAVAFGLQKVGEWRQTVPCSSDTLSPSDQTVRICVSRSRTRFFWGKKGWLCDTPRKRL